MSNQRRRLLQIAGKVPRTKLDDMKFLCRDVVPLARMERVRNALDLFLALEERGEISDGKSDFLVKILTCAGLTALANELGDVAPSAPPAIPLAERNERLFTECLGKIAQNLTVGEVQQLSFVLSDRLGVHADSIFSATQLFQLMTQRQLITPVQVALLCQELVQIGRSDMCNTLHGYLRSTNQPDCVVVHGKPWTAPVSEQVTLSQGPLYAQEASPLHSHPPGPHGFPHPRAYYPDDCYQVTPGSSMGQVFSPGPSGNGQVFTPGSSMGQVFSPEPSGNGQVFTPGSSMGQVFSPGPSGNGQVFTPGPSMGQVFSPGPSGNGQVFTPGPSMGQVFTCHSGYQAPATFGSCDNAGLPQLYSPPPGLNNGVYPLPLGGGHYHSNCIQESLEMPHQKPPMLVDTDPHNMHCTVTAQKMLLEGQQYGGIAHKAMSSEGQQYGGIAHKAMSSEGQQYGGIAPHKAMSSEGQQYGGIAPHKAMSSEGNQTALLLQEALEKKNMELQSLLRERADNPEWIKSFQVMPALDDLYPMNKDPHGLCIIINNHKFYHPTDESQSHPERLGAEIDQISLIKAFRYLHYEVEVHENLSSKRMADVMMDAAHRDHQRYDSFVCFILSHGEDGMVHGADCSPVNLRDLSGLIKMCSTLNGKPKLFFIQACRGDEDGKSVPLDPDIQSDPAGPAKRYTIPDDTDFFFGYATVPGKAAYRSRRHGSWFVTEICRLLMLHAHTYSLTDIMTKVNDSVSRAYTHTNDKQCTEMVVRLRKQVHFLILLGSSPENSVCSA